MAKRRLFNFVITDEMADALKAVKERDGISESEQVRRAVTAWLESREIPLTPTAKRAARRQGKRSLRRHK